jgi:quinoprotein dehydrogenase-associated probable ABC transporter substrate-binding protein
MSSASDRLLALAFALLLPAGFARADAELSLARSTGDAGAPSTGASADATLRVCADPNNLPFSNRAGAGFENALADLVARDLHRGVAYTWWPQRRGFVRHTLSAGDCDVVIGVPAGYRLTLTTAPYYRSSYVFVTRADRHLAIRSFDDPRLKSLRIGVHTIGDDYNNVPPARALVARGIVGNISGYSIYGDYSRPDPPRTLIDAVARGDVDVAIAWGPLAGYFAARERTPLRVDPVPAEDARADTPMTFAIAMGVRKDDLALRDALDGIIARRHDEIDALLRRYGVPLVGTPPRAPAGTGG